MRQCVAATDFELLLLTTTSYRCFSCLNRKFIRSLVYYNDREEDDEILLFDDVKLDVITVGVDDKLFLCELGDL